MKHTIVTVKWLSEATDNPDLIILDASIASSIDGAQNKVSGIFIPKARFFDLKKVFSNQESTFPNTVPHPEQFEQQCQQLGISSNSMIVIYDAMGVYSSPRVWWLFKVMGHQNVAVLDGGLPAWISEGYQAVDKLKESFAEGDFKANFQPDLLIKFEAVKCNCTTNKFLIVDARSKGRFEGNQDEPRKHLKSGHITNSVNIPYQTVLAGGKFKSPLELKQLFEKVIKPDKPVVYSCGSGLTACIIMLAGQIADDYGMQLYDGSWTEWAELNQLFTTS